MYTKHLSFVWVRFLGWLQNWERTSIRLEATLKSFMFGVGTFHGADLNIARLG
jgi:hypothetical protein